MCGGEAVYWVDTLGFRGERAQNAKDSLRFANPYGGIAAIRNPNLEICNDWGVTV
jgi:hypothetical protein